MFLLNADWSTSEPKIRERFATHAGWSSGLHAIVKDVSIKDLATFNLMAAPELEHRQLLASGIDFFESTRRNVAAYLFLH